jgi:hypothetical protein
LTDIEDEKRVFGGHNLIRTEPGNLSGFFVPPFVTTRGPRDFITRPSQDEDVFDERTLLEGSINDGLSSNRFATTTTLVTCDEDSALAILDTITK